MRKARRNYTPSTPPVPATLTTYKHLVDMTPAESVLYLSQLMERLQAKQARERAYLKRRADRGTRTPTDEMYESDQVLEDEVLALLGDLYQAAKEASP